MKKETLVEDTERAKMGEKSLKIQEDQWAEKLREEVRAEFPNISERQLESIVAVRLKALLAPPVNVKQNLKVVDMGDDKDLSINFKKHILK